MEMFSEQNDFLEENELSQNTVKQSILNHLQDLTQWLDKYFPEETDPKIRLDIITLHRIKYTPSLSKID